MHSINVPYSVCPLNIEVEIKFKISFKKMPNYIYAVTISHIFWVASES